MSKKHLHPHAQPRLVNVADKAGDEIPFPAAAQIVTNQQREVPNPFAALAPSPSERVWLRAATAAQAQRDAHARRERQQIVTAAERPAPTVREYLHAAKRRPLDAPMATPIHALPAPPASMIGGMPDANGRWLGDMAENVPAWIGRWLERWQFTIALAVWSAACLLLGMLI